VPPQGEKKSGGGEEGAERRVAADSPLLGAIRDQVEPDLSPREEEDVHVGRETGAAQEAERHRVRLPRTAIFVRTATTTPPTQREPTRSLSLLLRRSHLLYPCLSASLLAAVPCAERRAMPRIPEFRPLRSVLPL
jgi:hypothetical protein